MRIVVTGGAGFIGASFLNRFVPRHPEHSFINLDKLTYAANLRSLGPLEDAPNYLFEQVDVADFEAVGEVFDHYDPDAVLHLAAESHVDRSIEDPRAFIRTNVEGTFCLLEHFRRRKGSRGGRFHHVSTDEVYGSLGDSGAFTEASPYDPSSPYSATKAASDHLVRAYHRTYGLHTTLSSCSNNYGPLQFPEKLIPLMILKCLEGEPLPIYGDGSNVRDWLFVDDHCEGLWLALTRGRPGRTYAFGGGAERTNLQVVEALCDTVAGLTGRDPEALRALRTFVADRPGHDYRYAIDATRARRELGWRPRESFATGLERTVRWYLDHPDWIDDVRTGAYRAWIGRNYDDRPTLRVAG